MQLFLIFLISSFFLGSLPTGYLIGRVMGQDIRKKGSGNTGATNTARVLGKKAGIITLMCDLLKGAIPALLPKIFGIGQLEWGVASPETLASVQAAFGFAAILGHCYSPFLWFKGGKGVATSLGVFLVIAPLETMLSVGVFVLVLKKLSYVSLASMIAVIVFALIVLSQMLSSFHGLSTVIVIATTFVILRKHRENIARLRKGTEAKFRL